MPELKIHQKSPAEDEEPVQLSIEGSVDAYNSEVLSEKLESLLDTGFCKIIVDCENLDFISSSGMGVFMGIEDDLLENQGGLKFINVRDKILNVFEKVGLTDIFKIYDNREQAIADFSRGA